LIQNKISRCFFLGMQMLKEPFDIKHTNCFQTLIEIK
jgi:hypothetical protein